MSKHTRTSSLAALALAVVAAAGVAAIPTALAPRVRHGSDRKRQQPQARRNSKLEREIAEWNAAVEARKQAKALAKQRREAKA